MSRCASSRTRIWSREAIAAEVAQLQAALARQHQEFYDKLPVVPPDAIRPALPEGQPVIGYVDSLDGKFHIQARSRDRVMLMGWAAPAEHGAPLREIKLRIGDAEIGTIREFYPRPDVAAHFGRPNWLMSGWRTMIYLPALATGEHGLVSGGDYRP